MAIEIVPKPKEKEPVWLNILFYISIGFLMSIIGSYFLLNYLRQDTERVLKDVEEQLLAPRTQDEKELESSILEYQRKIDDFAFLLQAHQTNSHFFTFLEEITHPEVSFSEISLQKPSVELQGSAANFTALGQQLLIFQKIPEISSMNLSQIALGEGGKADFTFQLVISPKVFVFP